MLVLLVALGLAQAPPGQSVQLGEVTALLDAQQAAWNAGKLEAFVGYYAADAQFYSGGTITKGREAVLARYRKRYQQDGKEMGKLAFTGLEIVLLTPGHALARGRWAVTTKSGQSSGLFTLILHWTDGKWQIAHDHTSAAD